MQTKPKITHLVTPYLFHTGSWIYSQIKGVSGFEHSVFTQKKENLDQFPLNSVYSIEDANFIKQKINYYYFRLAQKYGLFFTKIVNEISPNLFHAHMGFEAVRWLDFVKKTNIPLVTTFYGQDVSKLGKIPYWQKKYKDLFKYCTLFLAEGPNLKKQLINIGCPSEKIVVQKLGLKIENYIPKTYEQKGMQSKSIILQVATFREKKGVEYSLEAIAILKKMDLNVEFRLIGAGDDNSEAEELLKKKVKELEIENVVKFLGKKAHQETILEMNKSDIFLHPSVTAEDGDNEGGSPVGITEAAAVGLPVVSTLHADIPEVVINNKTGYLVEERNSKALADKIIELIDNPQKIISFGKAGREHIISQYDINTLMLKLESIYKGLL